MPAERGLTRRTFLWGAAGLAGTAVAACTGSKGSTPASAPIWQVLAHVVNHDTQAPERTCSPPHRLRGLAGDIDLI